MPDWVSPRVSSSDVAFIVLMAGPGLTGEQILYLQGALIAESNGATEEMIARTRSFQERYFEVLKTEPDSAAADQKLRVLIKEGLDTLSEEEKQEAGIAGVDEETLIDTQVKQMNSAWFRYFLTYNPLPTLRKVACPVLAVNGEKDLQIQDLLARQARRRSALPGTAKAASSPR